MFKLVLPSVNPYDTDTPLFTKKSFIFEPGINILTGCNGSGKSTVIHYLKEYLDEFCDYIYFDRMGETKGLKERCLKHGPNYLFEAICSSEGEQNLLAFSLILSTIKEYVNNSANCVKDKFIIIDSFDSGLSIDVVNEIMVLIEEVIIPEAKAVFEKNNHPENNIYIIMAANDFEATKNQRCIDVRTASIKRFEKYEEYRKYIFHTKNLKNKRLNSEK